MEMKVNIPFNQLLLFVKQLTPTQKKKLKKELETDEPKTKNSSLRKKLLVGPVFTEQQLQSIEDTHKSINRWRVK